MDICEKLLSEQKNIDLHKNSTIKRMARRLAEIAQIGITAAGASCRVGYSYEDREAKELVKQWMRAAGLQVSEDLVGNVFGKLAGRQPLLTPVLCGSHLDTVINGGHFDGILGVISALEIVELWNEEGFIPLRTFEVVIFADEEGTRFHASLTGSQLMMGELTLDSLQHYHDNTGLSFAQVLQRDNLDGSRIHEAIRKPEDIHAFIELHIEQGNVLEEKDLAIGIVNKIAGPSWLEVQWVGEAGHAGGTPMHHRKDALAGAVEWMQLVEQLPSQFSHTAVATIGSLKVFPDSRTIIPEQVKLTIDIRDINLESRNGLIDAIIREAKTIAAKRGLKVYIERMLEVAPTLLSEKIIQQIKFSVEHYGIKPFFLHSGAGHDAMVIGRHIPTGMIFVRCQGGISHSVKEWVTLADISVGCQVLKHTLEQLVIEK